MTQDDILLRNATAHYQGGRLRDAEWLYRTILERQPKQPEANHNLGMITAHVTGIEAGLPYFAAAVTSDPKTSQYWLSYIDALIRCERTDAARRVLADGRRQGLQGPTVDALAAKLAPTGPGEDERKQLLALFAEGRHDRCEAAARYLTARFPANGFGWKLLGVSLSQQGRLEAAADALRKAVTLLADDAEAHYNLGTVAQDLGRFDEAEASLRRAVALKPEDADTLNNLANVLGDIGRFEEAESCYRQSLTLDRDNADTYNNLGLTLKDTGRLAEAVQCYRKALAIDPDFVDAHGNLLFVLNYGADRDPEACLEDARNYGRMAVRQASHVFADWRCEREPRRLRVGLVSGDFNNHPVGYFLESVVGSVDTERLELIAYPTRQKEDSLTARLKPRFSQWTPLAGLSDEAAAQRIHGDGIHVLIDLAGHTAHNRLALFARKPAPVQASWLGYFATTGVAEIDWLLADPWTLAEEEEKYFTEKIRRLPETRLCFTPPAFEIEVSALPARATGQITFGCFNNLAKVNDEVIAVWAKVLRAVAGSRLLLMARQLKEARWRDDLAARFAAQGIGAERLLLEGSVPRRDYLAAYGRVDIGLDPFPYPGGTTTAESLWMGVPVLTLAGQRFLSRQGVGLLANAGLPDWIADDAEDYVAKAAAHASDLEALAKLRAGLRAQVLASPLFDGKRFARHLEEALWGMWQARADAMTAGPSELEEQELLALYREGRHAEAEVAARAIVARHPARALAWKVLGLSLAALGHGEAALHATQRAAELLPGDAGAQFNLGVMLADAGQAAEAEASLRRAIEINPDVASGHIRLGHVLVEQGRPAEAEAIYRTAIAIRPDLVEAHFGLGAALQSLGRAAEAEACFRQALAIAPELPQAHFNLGNACRDQGKSAEAEAAYRRAIELQPGLVGAHCNLGHELRMQGRAAEAEIVLRQALELEPDFLAAHLNLGNALVDLGRYAEAEASLKRAAELAPELADPHVNLGALYKHQGRLSDAIASYRRALALRPDDARGHSNLGNILSEAGERAASEAAFRRALELDPDDADARSNLLFSLNYSPDHDPERCLEDACAYGRMATRQAAGAVHAEWLARPAAAPLRVGFVSGDLNAHPVGFFLEGILANLDPARLELFAYPTSAQEDQLTARIRPRFAAWRPLTGLGDQAAAQRIHDDGIEVLIDLSGHTDHNRLLLFARRPAPVQAAWLGYFATTGVAEIDYLLADPWTLPPEEERHFTEKIWRLPETRLCFTPPAEDVEVSVLPARTAGQVTFGCFNNPAKINDGVVDAWARILAVVPGSRLYLKAQAYNDAGQRERMAARFAAQGIGAERLVLEGSSPRAEYLAAYRRVDIGLDPFPYPGGTTTAESLWMGVPVLTLAGRSFLARQGVGLMANAGLEDWIADDVDDYVARAAARAADIDRLAQLRAGLRAQALASPVFDGARFARHFEEALWTMAGRVRQ